MTKQTEQTVKVESWYPSAEEILRTQREQLLKSRQEAAAFASGKPGKRMLSWWQRLSRMF